MARRAGAGANQNSDTRMRAVGVSDRRARSSLGWPPIDRQNGGFVGQRSGDFGMRQEPQVPRLFGVLIDE